MNWKTSTKGNMAGKEGKTHIDAPVETSASWGKRWNYVHTYLCIHGMLYLMRERNLAYWVWVSSYVPLRHLALNMFISLYLRFLSWKMETKMVHCVVLLVHTWQQKLVKWCYCCISSSRQFSKDDVKKHLLLFTTDKAGQPKEKSVFTCHLVNYGVDYSDVKEREWLNGDQLHCRRVPRVDMTHRTLWGNEVAALGKSPQPRG